MKYEGPLYGKVGRRYIKLKWTSADVDKMQDIVGLAVERIQQLSMENKQLRHTLRFNPLQLKHPPAK